MNIVRGKVALVTGAARGIGAATASLFAAEGAKVVLGDILDELCTETAAKINAMAGAQVAHAVHLDVRRPADWTAAVRSAENDFGGLDILINDAGVLGTRTGMEDTTEENWDFVLDVNLKGPWLGIRAVAGAMRRRGGGSIVNISSGAGLVGSTAVPAYHASKAGLTILTKCAALTYAAEKIRVNSVHPGVVDTAMMADVAEEFREYLRQTMTPIKRDARPEEIAEVLLFLASDRSSYMTGAAVPVDGGYTAM